LASYGLSTDGFGKVFVATQTSIEELDLSNESSYDDAYVIPTSVIFSADTKLAGLSSVNESLGNACVEPLNAFICDDTMYFSNRTEMGTGDEEPNTMWLHAINRQQSPFEFNTIGDVYNRTYNTLAYNPEDNFLYATFADNLLKIDKEGTVEDLGVIEGFRETQTDNARRQHYSGVIDRNGVFYIGNWEYPHSDQIFKIDIKTKKVIGTINLIHNGKAKRLNYVDMAINSDDTYLYLINGQTDANDHKPNQLLKVEISTGNITFIGDAIEGESLADTIFMDKENKIYVLFHEGGFYEIDAKTGKRTAISSAPVTAGRNDGAMCPNAIISLKPTITIGDASVIEGGDLEFPITFYNGTSAANISFKYNTADGNDSNSKLNAKSADDFEAKSSDLTVLPGDNTITITTLEDTLAEADEGMKLMLSNISGVLYHDSMLVAKGTIIDNDRPKGSCYATTDNYNKLFIYDDLNATDGLASPQELNLTKDGQSITLDGEGGAYRATDGYLYQFLDKDTDTVSLQKINLKSGEVSFVKDIAISHVDAAEFYYDEATKKEKFYIINKDKQKLYTIDPSDWSIKDTKDMGVYLGSLAINPYSKEAYATVEYSEDDKRTDARKLYKVDLDTGESTFLFDLPAIDVEGLAFANNGKLYTDNEIDVGGDKHRIFEIDLKKQTVIPVANSGTDNGTDRFHDIETLSCDAGVYQAPPIFTMEQKEITVMEGDPANKSTGKVLNNVDINFDVVSNRPIREGEDIKIIAKTAKGTADEGGDYTAFGNIKPGNYAEIAFPHDSKRLSISKRLVYAEWLAEKDEYFTCDFSVKENKGSFTEDESSVKIIIDDDDSNIIDAWDDHNAGVYNRKIRTEVVGQEFTLFFAKINKRDKQVAFDANGGKDFGDENNTRYRVIDAASCDAAYDVGDFIPFTFPVDDEEQMARGHHKEQKITINKAYKNARVQFYWEDQYGTPRVRCSTDSFSIRPDHYAMHITPSGVLKAGQEFNITIEAKDANDAVVTNYEEAADVYHVDYNETKSACTSGDLTLGKVAFSNGIAKITNVKYDDIGELDFTVSEDFDKAYALIDENDYASDDLSMYIEEADALGVKFAPANITIGTTFTSDATADYVFYAGGEVDEMAAKLKTTVIAVDASGDKVSNFKEGCYAHDVKIDVTYGALGEMALTPVLTFVHEQSASADMNVTQKTLSYDMNASLFSEGEGNQTLRINFERAKNDAKNPMKMTVAKVKASVDGLQAEATPSSAVKKFIYIKAHVPSPQVNVGKDKNITVDYEVYMDDSVNKSDFGFYTAVESEDEVNWYKIDASLDDSLDFGSLEMLTGDFYNPINHSAPSTDATALSYVDRETMRVVVPTVPYKDKVLYRPSKEYLKYHRFNASIDKHSFSIDFLSPAKRWSGKGDLGSTVDQSTSIGNGLQKMDW
jgi:hypothetical protein